MDSYVFYYLAVQLPVAFDICHLFTNIDILSPRLPALDE